MLTLSWTVYILQCGDDTLYTGITNDLDRRIVEHQSGKGAKYTRGRGPLKLIYTEYHNTMSEASKREAEIKSLDRTTKLKLVSSAVQSQR